MCVCVYVLLPRFRVYFFQKPDFDAFTFTGTVTVSLRIVRPIRRITLHALDVAIDAAASRVRVGDREVAVTSVSVEKENERAVLELADEVAVADAAELHLSFTGCVIRSCVCLLAGCDVSIVVLTGLVVCACLVN